MKSYMQLCLYSLKKIKNLIILLIVAVRIEIKTELFNTKQNIFICIKGKNDLPILQIERPLKIEEIEKKASELASFLQVPIKGA